MKKMCILCLLFGSGLVWGLQINSFEPSDGFVIGGPLPSGWAASSSSGGAAGISTNYPVSGNQCLTTYTAMGGSGYINYYPNYSVTTDNKVRLQIDIRPSDYIPTDPDYNFAGYGGIYFHRQDYYWCGGIIFKLEDYDGYDYAKADDYKITFLNGSSQELIGYFSPGAYYRYSLTIDRAAGKCTSRLETLGGGLVAQRTYTNTVTSIPLIYFAGANPSPCYYDQLVYDNCPPTDLTGDCFIDMADLEVLASNWFREDCVAAGWCEGADIDKSGDVGIEDLEAIAAQWLKGIRL